MFICSVSVVVAFSYFAAVSNRDFEIMEMFGEVIYEHVMRSRTAWNYFNHAFPWK